MRVRAIEHGNVALIQGHAVRREIIRTGRIAVAQVHQYLFELRVQQRFAVGIELEVFDVKILFQLSHGFFEHFEIHGLAFLLTPLVRTE